MIVVADSGPLIHLAAMDSLILLRSLYGEIHIPAAVYREVAITGRGLPGATKVHNATWISRRTIRDHIAATELQSEMRLDEGESEAIVLGTELTDTLLLLDDRNARRVAQKKHLLISGALGVLVDAKAHGLIASVRLALDNLVNRVRFSGNFGTVPLTLVHAAPRISLHLANIIQSIPQKCRSTYGEPLASLLRFEMPRNFSVRDSSQRGLVVCAFIKTDHTNAKS